MIIKFKNWEKFQARNDKKITHTSWFRLDNRIIYNEIFNDLNGEEFRFFIFLLCFGSLNKNTGCIVSSIRILHQHSASSESTIRTTLKRLVKYQVVEVDWTHERHTKDTFVASTEQNRTEQYKTEQRASTFDFESVYTEFPRKEGKSKGMEQCNKQIKTSEDFFLLSKAVKNYATKCRTENTEQKFIKQFSTFMNCWRDYLALPEKSKSAMYRPLPRLDDPLVAEINETDKIKNIIAQQFGPKGEE